MRTTIEGSYSEVIDDFAAGRRVIDVWNGSFIESVGVDTVADGDVSSTCEELAG